MAATSGQGQNGQGPKTLHDKLFGPGPKRILSLDGGGVRGVLAAGILGEIERRLKRLSGKPDFRLCDYFDLIGGTSTGSIIAAALALGRSAQEVARLYQELAPEVFGESDGAGVRKPKFDAERLDAVLAREFGEHELASPAFRCGFAVFTKRIDTGSAWTLTNNPRAAFWDGPPGGFPNKRFQVRKLVLASAAAPTYFEERKIRLVSDDETPPPGADIDGEFVDGGVAGLNDPSLQLLKVATLKPFGFSWDSGEDRLMIISVGTGYWRPAMRFDTIYAQLTHSLAPTAARALFALESMIHDASLNTLTTMQGLSRPPRPWRINGELLDMRGAQISPLPLLHFQRFDARLDDPAEIRALGLNYDPQDIERMRALASADNALLAHLHEIGRSAAEFYFKRGGPSDPDWERAIFPARFDPEWFIGPPAPPPRTRLEALGRALAGKPKN